MNKGGAFLLGLLMGGGSGKKEPSPAHGDSLPGWCLMGIVVVPLLIYFWPEIAWFFGSRVFWPVVLFTSVASIWWIRLCRRMDSDDVVLWRRYLDALYPGEEVWKQFPKPGDLNSSLETDYFGEWKRINYPNGLKR